MTRKEKLQLTRDGLKGYDRLERKSISDVDWIAFKLGIDHGDAHSLVSAVRAEQGKVD